MIIRKNGQLLAVTHYTLSSKVSYLGVFDKIGFNISRKPKLLIFRLLTCAFLCD